MIRKAYPDHGILAEESGRHGGDEYTWIIDPLDGTTNFLHGVSAVRGLDLLPPPRPRSKHGVVLDPLRGELFTAAARRRRAARRPAAPRRRRGSASTAR